MHMCLMLFTTYHQWKADMRLMSRRWGNLDLTSFDLKIPGDPFTGL
jgi:hypothetical protein